MSKVGKVFRVACFNASTLEVCPVPEAHSCLFFANTIVLDLVCLQIFEAKIKSSISSFDGTVVVTVFKCSLESVI